MSASSASSLSIVGERDGRIHVRMPFDLKNNFKSTFRFAKWDGASKTWSVSKNSRKRVEQWVSEAQGAAEAAAAAENDELAGEELERVRAELNRVRIDAERRRERLHAAEQARAQIERMRAEIDAANADLEQTKAAAADVEAENRAIVERVVDADAVSDAVSEMRAALRAGPRASNRKRFEAAQSELCEQRNRLEAVGLECPSLRRAIQTSWNRIQAGKDSDRISAVDLSVVEPRSDD